MTTPQIAQGLASLGRNGDSVLVHMTPSEVAGLQSIAQANGTSLTINPDTGMPEAFSLGNFFKSLLPTIAGFGVGMIPGMQPIGYGIAAGALTGAALNKKDPLMGAITGGLGGFGGTNLAANALNPAAAAADAATKAGVDPGIATVVTPGATPTAATVAENVSGFQNAANLNAGLPIGGSASGAQAGIASQAASNAGTFGGNFQQALSNISADPMTFLSQNKMGVGAPIAMAALSGLEPPTPGMTQEEYDAERRRRFNQPLNLAAGKPLNLGTLAAKGGEIRLAAGGAIAFDDGGSVPGSKLSLRREEEQMTPMQQMQPAQQMMQPAQTELGIAALKPGAENEVKIDITNAQLDPMQQQTQEVQPLAARAPNEGVAQLMQENGGQGVDFEKLYGRTQAPAPMVPMGGVRGFGPDGRRLAAGGSIQSGGVMDLYQGTDSQPTFGGDQGYGLGRLNSLAQQQSMSNAEQGRFAKGGVPKLEDGGFVVPADVVFYLGNHNTEAGQKRLAKMYGARPIKGPGTGLSDSIPTSIEGQEPAKIANGEAYIPRKVVKAHGGPKKFYDMMAKVRKKATGSTKQAKSA